MSMARRCLRGLATGALGAGGLMLAGGATSLPASADTTCGTSGVFSSSSSTATCTYAYSGAADTFTVPSGVTSVTITAAGGQGGQGGTDVPGGKGAQLNSSFTVTPTESLNVVVGGTGGSDGEVGGGGGGSFVYRSATSGGLLIAAAGGGGGSQGDGGIAGSATTAAANGEDAGPCAGGKAGGGGNGGHASSNCFGSGGGGGGLLTDGGGSGVATGGKALTNGATGGTGDADGGFGGGGGATDGAGGGGGYNGGGGSGSGGTLMGAGGGGGSFFASSGTGTSGTSGANTGDGQVVITYTIVEPPTVVKFFGAASIPLGGQTSLSFTITNPNASTSLTGVGFTDSLPSGLVVATPSNGLSGSCGGGTIMAVPDSGSVNLSGATLAASGSCTFSMNVMAVASGPQLNITSPVTSNEGGNGNAATSSLGVIGCAKGDNAYLFTGTTKTLPPTTILGVFCVAKTGMATYQQGTASGSGGLNINGSSNNFIALGPKMNLGGGTSGPTSQFTEVLPIKATGTYTLTKTS